MNGNAGRANFSDTSTPTTGLALKDDPALITLSLVNEANPGRVWGATPRSEKMYREKFAEWKKSNPDKSFEQFISFRAVTRFEEMKAALREIGCGTLLSDQNYRNNLTLSADRRHYDFVDNHGYWDHPRFAETPWKLPVLADQRNVLGALAGIPGRLFPSRLYGKGFTVTEFGYANPNLYRAVGPALMAAYGAFRTGTLSSRLPTRTGCRMRRSRPTRQASSTSPTTRSRRIRRESAHSSS